MPATTMRNGNDCNREHSMMITKRAREMHDEHEHGERDEHAKNKTTIMDSMMTTINTAKTTTTTSNIKETTMQPTTTQHNGYRDR